MSVGLLAVRLLYLFYVRVHLSKWYNFSQFLSLIWLSFRCLNTLAANVWRYEKLPIAGDGLSSYTKV